MKPEQIQACREWIARRTAKVDQLEKQFQAQYPFVSPQINQARLDDIEALRFWIHIHQWELDQRIDSDSDDEYPQPTSND